MSLGKLYHTFRLIIAGRGRKRAKYLKKHNLFGSIGNEVQFTPWKMPQDPKHIYVGDNVLIASNVLFINHDQRDTLINNIQKNIKVPYYLRDIHIGNNVMIGANVIILPGVNIGDNCIIGAGCVVSKDVPFNSVVVGNPMHIVGTFDNFLKNNL